MAPTRTLVCEDAVSITLHLHKDDEPLVLINSVESAIKEVSVIMYNGAAYLRHNDYKYVRVKHWTLVDSGEHFIQRIP